MTNSLDRRLERLVQKLESQSQIAPAYTALLGEGQEHLPEVEAFLRAAADTPGPILVFRGCPQAVAEASGLQLPHLMRTDS